MPIVWRVGGDLEAPRLDALLQRHFALSPTPGQSADGQSIEVALDGEVGSVLPGSAQLIEETPHMLVLRTGTGFRLEAEDSWIDLEPPRGVAAGALGDGFWDLPELTQRDFFLQTLVILLRERRAYGLHASGVEQDDTGLLVVGPSGQGKTTLALSLMDAGWGFLGDDVVALRQVGAIVEALAVRRSMSCTPTTLALFDLGGADAGDGEKKLVDVEFNSDSPIDRFRPNLLVFPEVADQPFSELEPLSQPVTVAHLGRSMAGIRTDPVWAERQLGVLASLAAQANGYRLLAGHDVYQDPQRVSGLLAERS